MNQLSHARARKIMGQNFSGLSEASIRFGVRISANQSILLSGIPFSEEVLDASRGSHVLQAIFPVSIIDIREIVKRLTNQTMFFEQNWYAKYGFSLNKNEAAWHLIRKTPIESSLSKKWDEQVLLIPEDEEPVSAQILVCAMVNHFLGTHEHLFEDVFVRCADLGPEDTRVYVGRFDPMGMMINCYDDHYRRADIGIATTKKK